MRLKREQSADMKMKVVVQDGLCSLALALLLGCNAMPDNRFKEEFHQTYPLSEKGSVRLENVNGRVIVTTWDRPEVKVDATKSASSEERLQETKIVVKFEGDSLSIKTEQPKTIHSFWRWNQGPASVQYTLTVPVKAVLQSISTVNGSVEISGVSAGLRASTVNGRLKARQISGNSQFTTVNGAIDAELIQLGKGQSCKLDTVNGHVHLSIPADLGAELEANTVNGGFRNDFGIKKSGKWLHQHIQATLGNGGGSINLTTVNGGISLEKTTAPKPVKLEVQ
jgi:DUF4097 and DUF4098 domain-containing protein YvlB